MMRLESVRCGLRAAAILPVLAIGAQAPVTSPAQAAQERMVGSWFVQNEKDPFSDGQTAIAVTRSGTDMLAVRCFSGKLSTILVLPTNKRDFAEGQSVDYQYRADNKAISEHEGTVFGDYSVELPNATEIFRDAEQAGRLAFRVSFPGGAQRTLTFTLKNGKGALTDVRAGCNRAAVASVPAPKPAASSTAPVASPQPQTQAALTVDATLDEATVDRLRKQIVQDASDAVAYASDCPTIEPNPERLALAAILTDQEDTTATLTAMQATAVAKRAELIKDPTQNLCADALVLFGPLGTRTRHMIRMKRPVAEPAVAQKTSP